MKTENTPATYPTKDGQAGERTQVYVDTTGSYNGRFQIWDGAGNEITREEELRLLSLYQAADDLLEACKIAVEMIENLSEIADTKAAVGDIESAIAKAEGGAQ